MRYTLIIILAFTFGCKNPTPNNNSSVTTDLLPVNSLEISKPMYKPEKQFPKFDRKSTLTRIKEKIKMGTPLFIHARIPLCDNENQGIIPVSTKLGNGLDLKNNLYWGAKYGVKNYFKRYTDWKLINDEKDVNTDILERLVFYKEFENKAKVYFVADAYRGDKMKTCLVDFFNSTSGRKTESITVNGQKIGISSQADLLIFNGHNGLMDYDVKFIESKDQQIRDVSVIGCISHEYFVNHLKASKGYPLLMTTNLIAPEAYVMEAVVNSWANLNNGATIRKNAGKAYHKYQKCGINGATRLFISGW